MNLLSKLIEVSTLGVAMGCGNGHMKEINPNGGTIPLYAVDGHVIKEFEADGKPEMTKGDINIVEKRASESS